MIKTPEIKNASFNWRKLSLLKVVKYVSFIIGAVILICVLLAVMVLGLGELEQTSL